MDFKKLKSKIKKIDSEILQEKSIAISFGKKTHFFRLKRTTQVFFLFFIAISAFNVFFIYKENNSNTKKKIVFAKNEELSEINQELQDKFESIQKQINLINSYFETIETDKTTDLKKTKKKKITKVKFSNTLAVDLSGKFLEEKMKNLYLKTEKRYKETQNKISSLQLFAYRGQNVAYTRYKKRNLKNIAIGGPFVKIDIKNNKSNVSSKNKSFEDMIKIAIENEKFIKLLPVGAPTKSGYRVSSGFGYRSDPWIKASAFHNGIDIVADKDEILSTIDGEVTFAGEMNGYGNLIEIKKKIDEDEVCIRFGHARKILVKTGDIVKKGQIVGMQGNEGRSTSKHIHYEAKYNDTYLNPKNLILITKL